MLARLPETYQWLIVPTQQTPSAPVEFQPHRLTGQDALAVRVSRKLRNDELLIASLAGSMLRVEMDKVPLWRGDHVSIRQLVEDFAQYPYLQRVTGPSVILQSASDGLALLTWEKDSFAYADGHDDVGDRYRALRTAQRIPLDDPHTDGLLVKAEVALRQLRQEQAQHANPAEGVVGTASTSDSSGSSIRPNDEGSSASPVILRRFHGSVQLDPTRVGRDAGRIAEEVIAHLAILPGANVKITLEIEGEFPGGVPDAIVRTVLENSKTLRFNPHPAFDKE